MYLSCSLSIINCFSCIVNLINSLRSIMCGICSISNLISCPNSINCFAQAAKTRNRQIHCIHGKAKPSTSIRQVANNFYYTYDKRNSITNEIPETSSNICTIYRLVATIGKHITS